jgi:hypothetical protein
VTVRGRGRLKIEVKSPQDELLWQQSGTVRTSGRIRTLAVDCPADRLRQAKLLSWVIEPESDLCVDSLGLRLRFPQMPYPERIFLISYAKLARCDDPHAGLVKDRAHAPGGQFDTVPTSGMYCLATCAAWKLGMVSEADARATLERIHRQVAALPVAHGILPHFVTKVDGQYQVAPGTEYSTVDTSLYYHSMLLAAQMLEADAVQQELLRRIQAIDFQTLHDDQGYVRHGFKTDGRTLLSSRWADWGGETALVLLLQQMTGRGNLPLNMERTGRVYRGVGFIGEIQSLFYPDFARPDADAVSGVNWVQARQQLLRQQFEYFSRESPAGELGLFGLSAGEGPRGEGYVAHGSEMPALGLIHPHYVLMSSSLWARPRRVYALLRKLEQRGLLPPWGLVENVTADLRESLPFIGSLNASFECLSAYHLWATANGQTDAIYQAARRCQPLRRAIRSFYPEA